MIITWLVFGKQVGWEEAPVIGEIKLEVDDDKHKYITHQYAHDLAKKQYGEAFGHVARKSRTEYHPNRHPSTITIYE